jgi:hypothetical protein
MKTCKKCLTEKPESEFYSLKAMRDGLTSDCKVCIRRSVEERRLRMMEDPEWVEKELARHRLKTRKYREDGRVKQISQEAKRTAIAKYDEKHPGKTKAKIAVNNAVRDKRLQKLPCSICGSEDSEGHHDDYTKPLDVLWLCPKHHAERHVQLRKQQRLLAKNVI